VADLEALQDRAEQIDQDLDELINDIWDHVPLLPECEKPCGDASVAVSNLLQYLAEQKEAQSA
jgi:hypothetical protein